MSEERTSLIDKMAAPICYGVANLRLVSCSALEPEIKYHCCSYH